MRPREGSLLVLRANARLAGLTEQYVSPRYLRGVIPSALLEAGQPDPLPPGLVKAGSSPEVGSLAPGEGPPREFPGSWLESPGFDPDPR